MVIMANAQQVEFDAIIKYKYLLYTVFVKEMIVFFLEIGDKISCLL